MAGEKWRNSLLPSYSELLQYPWPLLVQYGTKGRLPVVIRTNPFRMRRPRESLSALLRKLLGATKRCLILMMTMTLLFTGRYASADKGPDLIPIPSLEYPTQPTKPEMAKFINRCIDFDSICRATAADNNRLWRLYLEQEKADAYQRGITNADETSLQWYHWAGIIGGSVTAGVLGGFLLGLVVVK